MSKPLVIDYYSDILCIWAWIAERRNEELLAEWGDKIVLRQHYIDLFGDTHHRMSEQWKDRGGFEGFAKHVHDAAAPFDNAITHPDIWTKIRPTSSANAHMMIKAVEIVHGASDADAYALKLRERFFQHGEDISQLSVLMDTADAHSYDTSKLQEALNQGTAIAALMQDYQQAKKLNIKGSPSYIMNHGRQTLYGNVGYRVLNANIEEILKKPEQEASWC